MWLRDVRGQLEPELDCAHLAKAEAALAGLLEFEMCVPAKTFFCYLFALRDLGRLRLRSRGAQLDDVAVRARRKTM